VVIREASTTPGGDSGTPPAAEHSADPVEGQQCEAWTLNVSRGGCRVIVEESVTIGVDYAVQIGEGEFRPARVVWVRDEADGQIAGLQFLDVEGGEVPGSTYPSE
jgi:hypothetical protein